MVGTEGVGRWRACNAREKGACAEPQFTTEDKHRLLDLVSAKELAKQYPNPFTSKSIFCRRAPMNYKDMHDSLKGQYVSRISRSGERQISSRKDEGQSSGPFLEHQMQVSIESLVDMHGMWCCAASIQL